MKSGYFFQLDENTRIDKGIVIFRYMDFISKSEHGNKYPIYLVLKPESINVYIHRLEKVESRETTEHQNALLFSLPLTPNINHSIDNELRLLFDKSFTILEQECVNHYTSTVTYSTLKVFKLSATFEAFKDCLCKQSEQQRKKEVSVNEFYRKLLLDLIFDFEHHTIFENSPHYEIVASRLRDCFFFSSIAAKAEYYYQLKELKDTQESAPNYKIHIERLFAAKKQWLESITHNQGSETIRTFNEWFETIEDEHKVVFNHPPTSDTLSKISDRNSQVNEQLILASSSWFLKRYSLLTAIKVITETKWKKWEVALLLIFLLVTFLGFAYKVQSHNITSGITESLVVSYLIFTPIAIILIILCLIVFILFYCLLTPILTWILTPILTWINQKRYPTTKKSTKITNKGLNRLFGILSILTLPRLFMAITSSWIILLPSEDLWRTSFDVNIADSKLLLIEFAILFILGGFMVIELRKIATETSILKISLRTLTILLIGFSYSIMIGFIGGNLTGKRTLVRDQYLQTYYAETLKVYETSKQPNYDYSKVYQPATVYPNIDSTLAANIQFFMEKSDEFNYNINDELFMLLKETKAPVNSKAIFESKIMYLIPNTLDRIKSRDYWYFFPGMLVIQSIFALFIGVFIQLIFNEKTVTESF